MVYLHSYIVQAPMDTIYVLGELRGRGFKSQQKFV